jgi:type VI secretion system secreted protein Hcp
MPAFLKFTPEIKGQATDKDHKDWILIESMSAPIHRSMPQGARDQQRTQGSTTLGDVVIVRELDKSSTKLQEACANGTFYQEAQIDFCMTAGNKQEPYLTYKLKNVMITSYSFHGNSSGQPLPTEQITLGATEQEWTYIVINPETGKKEGSVPGKYNPGQGKGS